MSKVKIVDRAQNVVLRIQTRGGRMKVLMNPVHSRCLLIFISVWKFHFCYCNMGDRKYQSFCMLCLDVASHTTKCRYLIGVLYFIKVRHARLKFVYDITSWIVNSEIRVEHSSSILEQKSIAAVTEKQQLQLPKNNRTRFVCEQIVCCMTMLHNSQ